MKIRRAQMDDLEEVAILFDQYRMFYGKPGDRPAARRFLEARMEGDESVILLAESAADGMSGFVQLYPSFSSVSAARVYILNDLFVVPEQRRRGVARELLRAAESLAGSAGAVRLSLATATDNRPAQALYESLGWQRNRAFHHFDLVLGAER